MWDGVSVARAGLAYIRTGSALAVLGDAEAYRCGFEQPVESKPRTRAHDVPCARRRWQLRRWLVRTAKHPCRVRQNRGCRDGTPNSAPCLSSGVSAGMFPCLTAVGAQRSLPTIRAVSRIPAGCANLNWKARPAAAPLTGHIQVKRAQSMGQEQGVDKGSFNPLLLRSCRRCAAKNCAPSILAAY